MEGHLIILGSGIFGSDDDNAVSTLGTVDSGSRSILQDVHRSDVARRDIRDTRYRHTIDDIQRVVALGQRCTTADTNLDIGIRTTFRRRYRHTGQLTLQRLGSRGNRDVLELLSTHGSHRRYNVAFLRRTITGNDHFLKYLTVFRKYHIHRVTRDVQLLGLHTDVGENQHFRIIGNVQTVVTVEICHCTNSGTFHDHGSRDNRLSRLVLYRSANHTSLSSHTYKK